MLQLNVVCVTVVIAMHEIVLDACIFTRAIPLRLCIQRIGRPLHRRMSVVIECCPAIDRTMPQHYLYMYFVFMFNAVLVGYVTMLSCPRSD